MSTNLKSEESNDLLHNQYALVRILFDYPEKAGLILSQIGSDKFEGREVIKVFRAAEDLHAAEHTLNEQLILAKSDLDLKETQDIQYYASLSGGTIENLEKHVEIVTSFWMTKQLTRLLGDTVRKLVEKEVTPTVAMSLVQTECNALLTKSTTQDISLGSHIRDQQKSLEERLQAGDSDDDLFDLSSLNRLRGPKPPTGEVIAVVAPPKGGKSALLNNILKHHAENNIPLYYASGEMQPVMLANRLTAATTDMSNTLVSSSLMLTDPFLNNLWEGYKKRFGSVTNVMLDRNMQLSIQAMRRAVHTYYHKIGCRRFVFDRLGLFAVAPGTENEYTARNKIIAEIRAIANELPGLTIILCIQPTKEGVKKGRLSASDIFGGIGPAANITQAFAIWRPLHYSQLYEKRLYTTMRQGPFKDRVCTPPSNNIGSGMEYVEVHTTMSNNQPLGSAYLGFDSSKTIFVDIEKDTAKTIKNNVRIFAGSNVGGEAEIMRVKSGQNTFYNFEGVTPEDANFDYFETDED